MKITPLKKAHEIIAEFEKIIEKDCMGANYDAAIECAFNEVCQILRLSGLPQYQIIFWRSVEEHLKNIKIKTMTNIPKTIYLQIGKDCPTDDGEDFKELSEVSWCAEKIFENDIEYVLKPSDEDLQILKQIRNYFG